MRVGGVLALALLVAAPAVAANAWGFDTEAMLFSRYATGTGPSVGVTPEALGQRYVLPAADELSVRATVSDARGARVPGVVVDGVLLLDGEPRALDFREVATPEGDVVYDAQRVRYVGGPVRLALTFDFDADGAVDDRIERDYRSLV